MKKHFNSFALLASVAATMATVGAGTALFAAPQSIAQSTSQSVAYGFEEVGDTEIFFREAGDPSNPALVLLHGFPHSSHQYRELIPLLSEDYYLIAPDYPGFGASDFPSRDEYAYTFDNIAETVDTFLEQKGVDEYSLVIQDYGAPVGLRIATQHPERVQSIITQNGNLYEAGLNEAAWSPIMQLWEEGRGQNAELEANIAKNVFSLEGLRWQYTHGTRNPDAILPDNWILDHERLSRPGQHEVQLDLFYDYRSNVAMYPEWQAYLRNEQPPVLVVWGKNDAFFPAAGAEAFKRDVEDLDFNLLDTGHFALEEDAQLIARKIRAFLTARGID
ncbi:alpha/beta fold hydrolase [Erythrobacter rubeus]|uniref:Alpha/beta hydrolase n=1 Tax=Erythrobacter rubeus TaxID=2760803 RepID=A0ABR8KNF9_9SPHN|nr:alpha/beta hydrolase [Erythrobacter rubeus]MBD2842140.1 alpha/beta hydrolase [Erythrobacter rubeus]